MFSKDVILGKLSPFLNQQNVFVENQGVNDIITGLLQTHTKYESEYDKIYQYFIGNDLLETSQNIFQFLKLNVPYFIESNELQFLKSPASILSTESDCKSYALFSCGILDSIRRNTGEDIEVIYRFASYDPFDKVPQHTFCVVKQNGKEYWIDPVLNKFNERKQPYFFKDKIINKMSLVGLSGINNNKVNGIFDNTNFNEIFDSVLKSAPSIINATKGTTSQYQQTQYYPMPTTTQSTGISTNTLLLMAAAGLGLYFIIKRK